MRNLVLGFVVAASALSLLNCAGSSGGNGNDELVRPSSPQSDPAGGAAATTPATVPTPAPVVDAGAPETSVPDAATATASDAGADAAAADGSNNLPGALCQSLATCCGKLTNSLQQVACTVLAGKKNENLCGGGIVTFDCANAGQTRNLGPKCAELSACCTANEAIRDDRQCTQDWKSGSENLCSSDLHFYQTNEFGDCL